MHPNVPELKIHLEGTETVYQLQQVDLWEYGDLVHKTKTEASDMGLRLWAAFTATQGEQPKTFDQVKNWARAKKVYVEVLETVDPTLPEATTD
jgi:hypothetical protein